MMQLPVLAGREDAAQKLFAYNDLVMEMSGRINLTGIKDPEESLIKNVYDSLTVYDEKYFPENTQNSSIWHRRRLPRRTPCHPPA